MAHRIRYTMTQEPLSSKLTGVVEIDETYIGGKMRVGPQARKPGKRRRDTSPAQSLTKGAVVSVLQRGGHVHSRHVRASPQRTEADRKSDGAEDAHVMTDSSTVLKAH